MNNASNRKSSPKESIKQPSTGQAKLALVEHSEPGFDPASPRTARRPIAIRKVITRTERPRTRRSPAALLCGLLVPGQEARLDPATTRESALGTGLQFHIGNSLVLVQPDWQQTLAGYRNRQRDERRAYAYTNEAGDPSATLGTGRASASAPKPASVRNPAIKRTLKATLGCPLQGEDLPMHKKTWRH